MSLLSEDVYVENTYSCTSIYYIDVYTNGVFKHWFCWSIVCSFTRWIELYHTLNATALSAAECMLKHFGRFGAPYQLRSDNGPHFIADLIREFLLLIGVKRCLTLAYSKEENAIVERYNKEINRHLRALNYDNSSLTDYEKSFPSVQRILDSNHSDRLKISANTNVIW